MWINFIWIKCDNSVEFFKFLYDKNVEGNFALQQSVVLLSDRYPARMHFKTSRESFKLVFFQQTLLKLHDRCGYTFRHFHFFKSSKINKAEGLTAKKVRLLLPPTRSSFLKSCTRFRSRSLFSVCIFRSSVINKIAKLFMFSWFIWLVS